MRATTRTLLATLATALLLTGCATTRAPNFANLRLDPRSIVPTNDGYAVVAMGSVGHDGLIALRIRGCAEGHGEVDYTIVYLSGRKREGVVPWLEGDMWSDLCGERI
jgi:hypothetical protein